MYDPKDTTPTTKVTTFPRSLVDQREGRRLTKPEAKLLLPPRENRRLGGGPGGIPYLAVKEQAVDLAAKALRTEERKSASGVRYVEVERVVEVPAKKKRFFSRKK